MERNETAPTATERTAAAVRQARISTGGDQGSVADMLTELGVPTRGGTVARVERGDQPATVEQLLALALMHSHGLVGVLGYPLTVGSVLVTDEQDLRQLLLGPAEVPDAVPFHVASDRVGKALVDRRTRQLADELRRPFDTVRAAEVLLYGDDPQAPTAAAQVAVRVNRRLAEVDEPPGDATRRAWQAHALRAVAREVGQYLDERDEQR